MTFTYASPRALIDGLRDQSPQAGEELAGRLEEPVTRLCRAFAARHDDLIVGEELVARLLRWVEAHLLRLPVATIAQWDDSENPWRLFTLEVLAAIVRMMLWGPPEKYVSKTEDQVSGPPTGATGVFILDEREIGRGGSLPPEVETLIRKAGYVAELYYQSKDSVGGDWVIVGPTGQGGFWTIVADFSGKSWTAYVLKKCVYLAWSGLLNGSGESPTTVLQKLHGSLLNKLPMGTFVELTAGLFQKEGLVEIVSAGAGQLLTLDTEVALAADERLSAPLLGIHTGKTAVRQVWQTQFSAGDQVLMSTDGLYDQPWASARLSASLTALVNATVPVSDLHQRVLDVIGSALRAKPQHDDLTVLTVTRQKGSQ